MVYIPQRQGFGKADFAGGMATGALRMFTQVMLHRKQREEQLADEERGTLNQRALLDYQNMLAGKRSDVTFGRQQTRDETQHGYDMTEIQERARLTEEAAKKAATAKGAGGAKPMTAKQAQDFVKGLPYADKLSVQGFEGMVKMVQLTGDPEESRKFLEDRGQIYKELSFAQEEEAAMETITKLAERGFFTEQEYGEISKDTEHVQRLIAKEHNIKQRAGEFEPWEVTEHRVVSGIMAEKVSQVIGDTKISGANLQAAMRKLVDEEAVVSEGEYKSQDIADVFLDSGIADNLKIMNILQEALTPGSVTVKPSWITAERVMQETGNLTRTVGGGIVGAGQGIKEFYSGKEPTRPKYQNLLTGKTRQNLEASRKLWRLFLSEQEKRADAYSRATRKN